VLYLTRASLIGALLFLTGCSSPMGLPRGRDIACYYSNRYGELVYMTTVRDARSVPQGTVGYAIPWQPGDREYR